MFDHIGTLLVTLKSGVASFQCCGACCIALQPNSFLSVHHHTSSKPLCGCEQGGRASQRLRRPPIHLHMPEAPSGCAIVWWAWYYRRLLEQAKMRSSAQLLSEKYFWKRLQIFFVQRDQERCAFLFEKKHLSAQIWRCRRTAARSSCKAAAARRPTNRFSAVC